jgi:hypothetical protein
MRMALEKTILGRVLKREIDRNPIMRLETEYLQHRYELRSIYWCVRYECHPYGTGPSYDEGVIRQTSNKVSAKNYRRRSVDRHSVFLGKQDRAGNRTLPEMWF